MHTSPVRFFVNSGIAPFVFPARSGERLVLHSPVKSKIIISIRPARAADPDFLSARNLTCFRVSKGFNRPYIIFLICT